MAVTSILVVDDEELVLDAVKLTLTQHSAYAIETAGNPKEALAKMENRQFHLLITDLKMPGMTGEQLAREVKQKHPQMPVILLTGFIPNTKPPGVDLVLLKPFSTQELREAVARLTGSSGAGNDCSTTSPPATSRT